MPTTRRRANGEGTLYQRPDGRWQARLSYIDPATGKPRRISVYAASAPAARRKLKAVKAAYERLDAALQSQTIDPAGCYVYVLWGADREVPVYVGQSMNICQRIGAHMSDREKRALTRGIELIPCASADLMDSTELRLIREYRPLLNVVGAMPNE